MGTKVYEKKLFGNHIKTNKWLQDCLTFLICGGIDAFSISGVLLSDKNKKLVNIDASPLLQDLSFSQRLSLI